MSKDVTITNTSIVSNYKAMLEEAAKAIGDNDDEVENVVVVVAKKDGKFTTLTDINCPMTITLKMMEGAIKAIFETKLKRIKETNGEAEIVES